MSPKKFIFIHTSSYFSYVPNPVLVIIDVQPKELGIPTKAYYAVEEVKEVLWKYWYSWSVLYLFLLFVFQVFSYSTTQNKLLERNAKRTRV